MSMFSFNSLKKLKIVFLCTLMFGQLLANAQNYPMQTLTNLMNLGRSTPTQTTQTQYQAPPSTLSQLTGAGIAGLGLYNATK